MMRGAAGNVEWTSTARPLAGDASEPPAPGGLRRAVTLARSSTTRSADSGRAAGSFAKHRITMSSTSGSTPGQRAARRGGSVLRISWINRKTSGASNGGAPAQHS